MTKLYMENWLSVLAGVYLLGMVLYGHHRGFIRLVVSMLAVVLSLTVVRAALPSVTGFLKENTGLQQTISENMKKSIGLEPEEKPDGEALEAPSVQRTVIIARLPILSGINKIAGAVLGGVEGLVFLWIAGLLVTAFSGTQWGLILTRQIEASKWLSYLYSHNFLNLMVLGVLRGFL